MAKMITIDSWTCLVSGASGMRESESPHRPAACPHLDSDPLVPVSLQAHLSSSSPARTRHTERAQRAHGCQFAPALLQSGGWQLVARSRTTEQEFGEWRYRCCFRDSPRICDISAAAVAESGDTRRKRTEHWNEEWRSGDALRCYLSLTHRLTVFYFLDLSLFVPVILHVGSNICSFWVS